VIVCCGAGEGWGAGAGGAACAGGAWAGGGAAVVVGGAVGCVDCALESPVVVVLESPAEAEPDASVPDVEPVGDCAGSGLVPLPAELVSPLVEESVGGVVVGCEPASALPAEPLVSALPEEALVVAPEELPEVDVPDEDEVVAAADESVVVGDVVESSAKAGAAQSASRARNAAPPAISGRPNRLVLRPPRRNHSPPTLALIAARAHSPPASLPPRGVLDKP
jgi:hypothetical protein